MSRFEKLLHVIWHCKFHIVWGPKYRYRVLNGKIGNDHVHLLITVLTKIAISKLMGVLKEKTAIRVFNKFSELKKRPYWGNHFWAEGYCVDTVGLDSEMIKKYVRYQEDK